MAISVKVRIVINVLIVATASCASLPDNIIVSFVPATSNSYERRDDPPRISTLTDGELVAGGHINLGTATAERIVEKCWDKTLRCESGTRSVSATTALLVEAMNHGADVVVLSADRKTIIMPAERRGSCVEYRRVCGEVWRHTCDRSQPHVNRHLRCNERCRKICTAYEKITGSVKIETSRGTLWRNQLQ